MEVEGGPRTWRSTWARSWLGCGRGGGGGDVKVLSSDLDGVLILGLPAGWLDRCRPGRGQQNPPETSVEDRMRDSDGHAWQLVGGEG